MRRCLKLPKKASAHSFTCDKKDCGIGLINKLKAYRLQDNGLDTVEANNRLGLQTDLRHYGVGAQILLDLGIRKFRFLTNNPKKVAGLEGFGLEMVEQIPLVPPANDHNRRSSRN